MTERDALLNERQKTHGSFEDNARISQALKLLFVNEGFGDLCDVHREALDMIVPASPAGDPVQAFVDGAQDFAHAQREFGAESGEPELPRAALDLGGAERFFEFLDLDRHGRLRNGAGFRRASEMAMPGERLEIAELPERGIHHSLKLSRQSENST